jgi:hypothetical protein
MQKIRQIPAIKKPKQASIFILGLFASKEAVLLYNLSAIHLVIVTHRLLTL